VEERGKQGAVRRGDAWPVDLPLQDGQLVAQCQYLDVLVDVADRQQPYEGEHTRHGEVATARSTSLTRLPAITGRSRKPARHRPWMGFSAPAPS
jgi:hypothetical protein